MNDVETTVRERAAAYQEWIAKAGTVAGAMFRKDTVEAFNAFCAGWNAARASADTEDAS